MEASLPKGIKFFRVEWSIPCAVFHQVKCINCEKDVIVKKGGVCPLISLTLDMNLLKHFHEKYSICTVKSETLTRLI